MAKDTHEICQICGTELEEPIVWCCRCSTPHHSDCWNYYGECSTYGCQSKKALKRPRPTSNDIIFIGPKSIEGPVYRPRPKKTDGDGFSLPALVFWPAWKYYELIRKRKPLSAFILAFTLYPISAILKSYPLYFFYIMFYGCLASWFYKEKRKQGIKFIEVKVDKEPLLVIDEPKLKRKKRRKKKRKKSKSKRRPHHGLRKRNRR